MKLLQLFRLVVILAATSNSEARAVGRKLLATDEAHSGARGAALTYRGLGSCDMSLRPQKEDAWSEETEASNDDDEPAEFEYIKVTSNKEKKSRSGRIENQQYERRLSMSKSKSKSNSSSRSSFVPMRMRMRFPVIRATGPPRASPTVAPNVTDTNSTNTTAAPTVFSNATDAPSASPRTRAPRQPRRMRRRRPMRNRSRSSGSKASSRSGSSRGRNIRYRVQGELEYVFFPGTGATPFASEVNSVLDATEEFYLDTFDSRPLTSDVPIIDFRMGNLLTQYAPDGDLDRFVLSFVGTAVAPLESSVFLTSSDIARIMARADYDTYILDYLYELEPFTENIFFQTNQVFFTGQAAFS